MRSSIHYIASRSIKSESGINAHMFREDIHLGIMPHKSAGDVNDYSVEIKGGEEQQQHCISVVQALCRYTHHHSTEERLTDAVEHIVMALLERGYVFYELDVGEDGKMAAYWFNPQYVFRFFRYYVQFIPLREYRRVKKVFAFIHAKKVWKVSIPKELGRASGYRRLVKRLRSIDSLGPSFTRANIINTTSQFHYDPLEYRKNETRLITRLARKWGWNRRDYSNNSTTEFYWVYKAVNMQKSRVVLRTHIFNEINRLLKQLKINATIIVHGIPDEAELRQALDDFESGKYTIDDMSKYIGS